MTKLPIVTMVIATACAVSCAADGGRRSPEATAAIDIPSGFAEVHLGQLYYESAGSGDVVVLIHGNVGDRRHWDAQFSPPYSPPERVAAELDLRY